jgi:hypothetical protein
MLVLALAVLPRGAQGQRAVTHQEELPNFDRRVEIASTSAAHSLKMRTNALANLRALVPSAEIQFDGVSGAPKFVQARNGLLTGINGEGRGTSAAAAGTVPVNDRHRPVKAFLQEHRELFGHGPEELNTSRVKRDFVAINSGMRTTVWQQELDGIEVFEARLIAHMTKNGELVNVSSQMIPNLAQAADNGTPGRAVRQKNPIISAAQAVAFTAQDVGDDLDAADVTLVEAVPGSAELKQKVRAPRALNGDAEAKLVWMPMDGQHLKLCWDVILTSKKRGEMFNTILDAGTGEVQVRRCLTHYISPITMRVYTSDSPSPFSPGHPTPLTNQPPLVTRQLVILSALNTNASPNGWIDDDVNETRGNNVDAHTDLNADDVADTPRPQGSPSRTFDFTVDLAQSPSTYRDAAVVQLFYLCNWYHDKLYELGFTEAAGNFQGTNFGRGGLGNDTVQADAQDGSGTDNANFSTPPDGSPGRMQMYVFSESTPDRDGDLDAEIVFHEYTHGLSWRLVGGGDALGTSQSDGMGEGWSDFYGLALLSESGDDVNGNYAAGGYVTYQLGGLTQNYYYGIRRYPYSTDMTKNPLTFKDIDPAQASSHSGVPRSPIIGNTANEVHNQGEVWCVTLWEARANLVNKYGWAVGNQLILQLTTDGMKLTPPQPNFLQARDGILLADLVNNGGTNQKELWAAFAKRGMGASATSPASSTTTGLVEAYDLPDDLVITPAAGFTAKGPVGGPFDENSLILTLWNTGSNSLNWSLVNTSLWLTVAPASGTIAPGATSAITATLNANAASLPLGVYTDTVRFTNLTSLVSLGRAFKLHAGIFPVNGGQQLAIRPQGAALLADAYNSGVNYYSEIRVSSLDAFGMNQSTFQGYPVYTFELTSPDVAVNETNGVAVFSDYYAWASDEGTYHAISMFRFDTNGTPTTAIGYVEEFALSQNFNGIYPIVRTDMNRAGRFAVVYTDMSARFQQPLYEEYIYVQMFNADGSSVGPARRVNQRLIAYLPAVAVAPDGSAMTVWEDASVGTYGYDAGHDIYARRIDANGNPIGNEFRVNATSNGRHNDAEIAVATNGTFAIVWTQSSSDADGVYLQRFNADGTRVGPETRVSPYNGTDPQVAISADGRFVVAWQGQDDSGSGIFAQRFLADGSFYGGAVWVNEGTTYSQTAPLLGIADDGTYIVKWREYPNNVARWIAWNATNQMQIVGPRVQTISPLSATAPVTNVTVTFDRLMNASTFTTTNAQLIDPVGRIIPITSIQTTDNQAFQLNVAAQLLPGTYQVFVGPTIRDANGAFMDEDGDAIKGEMSADVFKGRFSLTSSATASFPVAEGFENGPDALTGWRFDTTYYPYTVLFTNSTPHSGTSCLFLRDVTTATLALDLSSQAGQTNLFLQLWARNGSPSVELSGDGTNWYSIVSGFTIGATYTEVVLDLDRAAATNNVAFDQDVYLRFSNALLDDVRVQAGDLPTAPKVVGFTPTTLDSTNASFNTFTVAFDKAIDPATFTGADLSIVNPWRIAVAVTNIVVTAVPGTGNTQFAGTFVDQIIRGEYIITIGPNIADTDGHLMNQNGDTTYGFNGDAFTASVIFVPTIKQTSSGSIVFEETFENWPPAQTHWSFQSYPSGYGSAGVYTVNPHRGTNQLFIHTDGGNISTTSHSGTATLALDLSGQVGQTNLFVELWMKGNYTQPFYVEASNDAQSWKTLLSGSAQQSIYSPYTVDLDQQLATNNVALTTNVYIRFRRSTGTSPYSTVDYELYLDDVRILAGDPSDLQPPNIVTAPTNQTAVAGSNATFSITASGTAPLEYQWRFNGTNLLFGATNATLQLTNVQSADAGGYSVMISNAFGTTVSSSATLTVIPANDKFTNRFTLSGTSVTTNGVNVSASKEAGEPNHAGYSGGRSVWWTWTAPVAGTVTLDTIGSSFNTLLAVYTGSAVTNLTTIASDNDSGGSGTSRLTFAAPAGAAYQIAVDGFSAASGNIVLNLSLAPATAPSITAQPQSQTVVAGMNVTFNVAAAGTAPIFYQWQFNGTNLVGKTNSSIVLTNVQTTQTGNYGVVVSNIAASVTSSNALLTVAAPGTLLDHFAWSLVASPQHTSVPFAVTITAKDVLNNTVTNFVDTVALDASTIAVASNILGSPVHSSSANNGSYTLGYAFTPMVDIQVTHVRHYFGNKVSIWTDSGALLASQSVTSTPGTWIETTLTSPVTLAAGTRYRIGAYTAGATYYWHTSLPTNFVVGTINQGYEASGDSFPASTDSVRWWFVDLRYTSGPSVPIAITPTNSGQFASGVWAGNITAQQAATGIVLRADDGAGHIGTSGLFLVATPPAITAQPTNQTVVAGSNATFTVTAAGTTPLRYQWRKNGTNITAETNATLTLTSVTTNSAADYTVVVTNVAGSVTSAVATLTVLVPPAITGQPTNRTVVAGTNTSFSVTATGSAPLSYQWRKDGTPISDATNATVALNNVTTNDAGVYTVVVTNIAGSVSSSNATLTVTVPPSITGQPTNQTVIVGSNATFTVTADGTTPLRYQWRKNGANVVGATNTTLSLISVTTNSAANYDVVVTNVAGSVTSGVATLTVLVPPTIAGQPTNQTVVAGSNAVFGVTATGTAPLSYQWRKDGTNVVGATNTTLSLISVSTNNAGIYSVVVTNIAGSVTSSNTTLTVTPAPGTVLDHFVWNALSSPQTSGVPFAVTITAKDSSNITVTNFTGSVALTGTDALSGSMLGSPLHNSSGSIGNTYTLGYAFTPAANIQVTHVRHYFGTKVSIWTESGTLLASQTVTSTPGAWVETPLNSPLLLSAGSRYRVAALTAGDYYWHTALPADFALGTIHQSYDGFGDVFPTFTDTPQWWFVDLRYTSGASVPVAITPTNSGQFASGVWAGNITAQQAATGIVLRADDGAGHIGTSGLFLVATPPAITAQPTNQTVIVGNNATFSVTATGTAPLRYQWRKDGTNVAGATNTTLALTSVTTNSAGAYTVIVTNVVGSVTSSPPAVLTVTPPLVAPLLGSPFYGTNQFRFLLPTQSGISYQLQFTPSLTNPPPWVAVGTVTGDGTTNEVTLNASSPAGFYRVVVQP